MVREEGVSVDGLWAGFVRTEAGMTSGWHHHGEYETAIYIIDGIFRIEFGADGSEVIEATAGDFLHVPPGAVHREHNPGAEESHVIVVRAGHGEAVTNVDGPAH
jgi:uncharacterized RmlC-like cupin family protein